MQFLGDIQGAADFNEGRADHISGIAVEGDSISFTLDQPSGDFLNRLTLPYFCPLPVGTPAVPGGSTRRPRCRPPDRTTCQAHGLPAASSPSWA